MNIQKAYCIEKGEVVDIYQARDFYFSRADERKLNFLCFDDKCRKTLEPKVIGVNYRKSIDEGDHIVNRPHFRENPNYRHLDDCPEFEFEQVRLLIEAETDSGETKVPRHASKASNVIDVFSPLTGRDIQKAADRDDAELIRIQGIPDRDCRLEAYKKYIRTAETHSSILQDVASCFVSLNDYERRNTTLRIGRVTKTYAETFTHLSNYFYKEQNDTIIYGGASLRTFPTKSKNPTGYTLRFFDPVNVGDVKNQLTLFIPLYKILQYKYGNFLKSQLEMVVGDKNLYVKCYFWGNFINSPYPKTLNVELAHLNNLFLRAWHRKSSNPAAAS